MYSYLDYHPKISKITLFTSLERNIFLLSSISIALFGISFTINDMYTEQLFCRLGAIIIALLSLYNIFIANRYLNTKNNKFLLYRLNTSSKLFSIILVILCITYIHAILNNHDATK